MEAANKQETFRDILKSGTPVLVDFYADWCGPCQMMKPVLQELREHYGDKLRILKIDVDKNPAVAQAFQVQGIPTLILFKNEEIAWRQSGAMPAKQLEQVIDQFI